MEEDLAGQVPAQNVQANDDDNVRDAARYSGSLKPRKEDLADLEPGQPGRKDNLPGADPNVTGLGGAG